MLLITKTNHRYHHIHTSGMIAVYQQCIYQVVAYHLLEKLKRLHRPIEIEQGQHHASLHRYDFELQCFSDRIHHYSNEIRQKSFNSLMVFLVHKKVDRIESSKIIELPLFLCQSYITNSLCFKDSVLRMLSF